MKYSTNIQIDQDFFEQLFPDANFPQDVGDVVAAVLTAATDTTDDRHNAKVLAHAARIMHDGGADQVILDLAAEVRKIRGAA
jgi:hypothetical protein